MTKDPRQAAQKVPGAKDAARAAFKVAADKRREEMRQRWTPNPDDPVAGEHDEMEIPEPNLPEEDE